MSQLGRKIVVGLAKEATRGTAVLTAGCYPSINDNGIQDKVEKVRNSAALGVIEAGHQSHIAKEWGEGDFKGILTDKTVLWLFTWLFGQASSAANTPEAGATTHTFNVMQGSAHQSMTVLMDDSVSGDRAFALAMLGSLEISVERGKEVEFSATFKSKKGSDETVTVALTQENAFLSKNAVFKIAANLAGLTNANTVVNTVQKLSLKFEKEIEEDYAIGSTQPNEIFNKEFKLSGSIDLRVDDATYRNLALAENVRAMRLTVPVPTVTLGASTNPSFEFSLAKVVFDEIAISRGLGDVVMQALNFTAEYSLSDAQMVTGKIINNVASI